MSGETENWNKLGLEEIVWYANRIGLEYVESKKSSEYYEMMKPTMRAKIAMRIDDGKMTEAKLKRLTEADPDYTTFIDKLVEAKLKTDKLRVRYDSYKNLFDAKRSLLSYQKEELKLI